MRYLKYPYGPPEPYTGNPPTMAEVGPSDLRYSSGTAFHYQSQIDRRYGRALAGQQDENMKQDDAYTTNELAVLAELDDVQGSGIFEPPGTHPNIWPDAGVFAVSYSIPGYYARERMFQPSEIRDATTGRPIVPVPSGAVAIDNAAIIAQMERKQYRMPEPVLRANSEYAVQSESTANVMQNPLPLGADDIPTPGDEATSVSNDSGKFLMAAVGLGIAGAALYVMLGKKKQRKNGRRR